MKSNNMIDPNKEIGNPPYPRSNYIKKLYWENAKDIIKMAKGILPDNSLGKRDGSDNWPLTWGFDDYMYTAYGDGYGFDPVLPNKLGMGFAKILGNPPNIEGVNVRSNAENINMGRNGKKASGAIMVDNVLYLWLFHADENGGMSQLAWSYDGAKSFEFSEWKFREFGLCSFINYGKNYTNAKDDYIYTVTHDGMMADVPADRMILMRVHKNSIVRKGSYEFFKEMKGEKPFWTKDINERGSIFENRDACLRSCITYNLGLDRYMWWQQIPNEVGHIDRGDTRFSGGFGIYEAPYPWGPWKTVYYTKKWDVGPGERAEFPTKWMSEDGTTVYLVFSGDDSFCVRKAKIELW